ncbi:MAG: MarR family transcriptional regulator [Alicyclobacillus sp.]|nr:MarR family transcriptional regulator [Alicyclobacillus sp.]
MPGLDASISDIEYQLAIFLRRALLVSHRYGTLDRSGYLLLRQLEEQGLVGVKELADRFRLDVSTVSRQTSALESKGLIERIPDPHDGRASRFRPTASGVAELERAKRERFERFSHVFADWPEEDVRRFAALLIRLNQTLLDL